MPSVSMFNRHIHLPLENCGTHQQPNKEKHPPHVVWVVTSHFSWKRQAIAAETMHAVALWDRIKEPEGSLWHQVQRRTHHNPIRTHQVGRLLRGADGEVSEETQRIVQEQFKGITPTVLTEDSIRVGRLGEVRQNIKRVFKNASCTRRSSTATSRWSATGSDHCSGGARLFDWPMSRPPKEFRADKVSTAKKAPYFTTVPLLGVECVGLAKALEKEVRLHAPGRLGSPPSAAWNAATHSKRVHSSGAHCLTLFCVFRCNLLFHKHCATCALCHILISVRFLEVRLVVGVARVASSLGSHCKKAQMTACTTACRVQEPSKPDNEDPSLRDEDGDALVPGTLPPTNHTPTQPLQKDLQDLDPGSTQPMRRRSVAESSTQPLGRGSLRRKRDTNQTSCELREIWTIRSRKRPWCKLATLFGSHIRDRSNRRSWEPRGLRDKPVRGNRDLQNTATPGNVDGGDGVGRGCRSPSKPSSWPTAPNAKGTLTASPPLFTLAWHCPTHLSWHHTLRLSPPCARVFGLLTPSKVSQHGSLTVECFVIFQCVCWLWVFCVCPQCVSSVSACVFLSRV